MSEIYAPGTISRFEPATGLLVRGIAINGEYLIVDNCDIYPRQEMSQEWYVQGGPRGAIAIIGEKHVEGQITCPIRVDRNGDLEAGIWELIQNAQLPVEALTIKTNHILSISGLTAEYGGTDDNKLVALDDVIVKHLSLTASPRQGVQLKVDITGMINAADSELVTPPENYRTGRQLSFSDCDASRYESAMRTISNLEVTIENQVSLLKFLNNKNVTPSERTDQIQYYGVKSTQWGGSFEEALRIGVERNTFIHGGFMKGENLTIKFGPISALIQVPLFKIGEQPLSSKILSRKTSFFSQITPSVKEGSDMLFTVN